MMARKKVVTTEEMTDPEIPPQPIELPPSADELEYAAFEDGIAPGMTRLKIYRLQDGAQNYCYSCETAAFTEESLRRRYPQGGEFVIRFLDSAGHFHGSKRLNLDAMPVDPALAAVQPAVSATSAEISLLRDQVNRQHEMILKFMDNRNGAGTPPINTAEIMSMVRDMAAMARPPDVSAMLGPLIELFTKTFDAARESAGGDSTMSWLKLATGALEKLPVIVNQIAAQKAQAAAGAVPVTPEARAAALLTMGLGWLKKKAVAGKAVEMYVDMLADNIDDEVYGPVAVAILNAPFEEIGKYDPEIMQEPLRTWFFKLYNELRKVMYENNEPVAGETGSDADIKGNAPSDD